ncbi:MAG: zinc metallopeptidase [Bacillota bacterium]
MVFFYDWTLIILIPGMILAIWAQSRVSHNFNKYSEVYSNKGYTAAQVARILLDYNGLENVRIEQVSGRLTDHYDPRDKTLRLSDSVYSSGSIAGIAVAAHECGHAIQDKEDYSPMRIRGALVPVANIGNYASWLILIVGIIFGNPNIAMAGVLLFGGVVLFQLVTLPVEFNASNRALAALDTGGFFDATEMVGAKKVLNAAALTYVAAMITAVLTMVRLLVIALGSNRE